jgi:hypothetical protein
MTLFDIFTPCLALSYIAYVSNSILLFPIIRINEAIAAPYTFLRKTILFRNRNDLYFDFEKLKIYL